MRAIIFGISGQDGYYLSRLLNRENIEVLGVGSPKQPGDIIISSYESVGKVVKDYKPDFIFHLAAKSLTQHDFLFQNHEIICTGAINILEAVRNYAPLTKVFISGSALQFRNTGSPISEETEFSADSAYAMSRIHATYTARYFRQTGLKVYTGYFFNHDSPLRQGHHLSQRIADAVKDIRNGGKKKITIGDLNAIKEYTFAGDVVNAVWKFVNQDELMEVVIGSGKGYSVKDWVQACFRIIGKDYTGFIESDLNFVPGYKQLVSDPAKLFSLQWRPEISFEQLAEMMMQ
jgi:GDPmannose 4,6-dehydratase